MEARGRKLLLQNCNRELLMHSLSQTDQFMEMLFSKDLIDLKRLKHHQQLHHTDAKIADVMQTVVRNDNDVIFNLFLDWLKDSEQVGLHNALTNSTPQPASTELTKTDDYDSAESDCESLTPSTKPVMDLPVKKSSWTTLKNITNDAQNYDITQPVHGSALVFVNGKFLLSSARAGSQFDAQNLNSLFSSLGYNVMLYWDNTKDQMLNTIHHQLQDSRHWNYGSFVLCFISHGDNGCVLSADDKKIYIHELIDMVDGKNFPAMAGKPKFLFFDTSSGTNKDEAYPVTTKTLDANFNTPPLQHVRIIQSEDNSNQMTMCQKDYSQDPRRPIVDSSSHLRVPAKANFVVFIASFPSYRALHHKFMGSICTRVLVEVFSKHAHHEHILDLLLRVRRKISTVELIGRKQVPVTQETLTKNFYMLPQL